MEKSPVPTPSRLTLTVSLSLLLAFAATPRARAQARPLPSTDVRLIYRRLLRQIEAIEMFDHHGHPGYPGDPDIDAMPLTPSSTPLRLRDSNPELVAAARSLFGYPYADLAPGHTQWLVEKTSALREQQGQAYFDHILDKLGIETAMANRVAMPDYLDPARFHWVFFVDSFLFPFDNRQLAAANPDEAAYLPMQEKLLHRYMRQAGIGQLPATFDGYLSFISRVLEQNQQKGGVAVKFEAAYFRSLYFTDPTRDTAAAVYAKYHAGGVPAQQEYTAFEDFVFRYLVTEGGRLHLPVHIHTAVGTGDYFTLRRGNVLNLENVLRDPRYLDTTFVLLHGGYPYSREAIWLAMMKNVYLDSSLMELMLYPSEFKSLLKLWLETLPGKITFGTDAFPFNQAMGAEEAYWLGVKSTREALAAALAEMVSEGEISEKQAIGFAHGYLHDNAARLYPSVTK